jgi:hypothetical protein
MRYTLKDFHPRGLESINETLEALWKKEHAYHIPKRKMVGLMLKHREIKENYCEPNPLLLYGRPKGSKNIDIL